MKGRLEALVTLASNWTLSATNGGGGPSTCTITAGTYYPSALVTAIQTALNAGRPSGWTVTTSWGESSANSGLVTINCSSTPWALTFTSVDVRTFLGYSADITSRSSALAASKQSPSIWQADCDYWSPYDVGETGHFESDMRQTESPRGAVKTLYGNKKTVLEGVRWDAVSYLRSREAQYTVHTPFERWWRWTQLGEADGGMHTPGSRISFYSNADNGSAMGEYKLVGMVSSKMTQIVQGWAGRYRIELPRLVKVPS